MVSEINATKNVLNKQNAFSQSAARYYIHVNGFSDLVDLWVVKIKMSMILCARSTWRLSVAYNSFKRYCRSQRESMQKVCIFYSQNNKITYDCQTWQTHLMRYSRGAQKFLFLFVFLFLFFCFFVCFVCFCFCFSDADWLDSRISIIWVNFFHKESNFNQGPIKGRFIWHNCYLINSVALKRQT